MNTKSKLLILSSLMFGALGAQSAMAQAFPTDQLPPSLNEQQSPQPMPSYSAPVEEAQPQWVIEGYRKKAVQSSEPRTRAEVIAETRRAIRAGEIAIGDQALPVTEERTQVLPNTRGEVVSEIPAGTARNQLKDQRDSKVAGESE
jgi:hypothetical protein